MNGCCSTSGAPISGDAIEAQVNLPPPISEMIRRVVAAGRRNCVTPPRQDDRMNNVLETSNHYAINVRPAFAARHLADLRQLGEALREGGAADLAEAWYEMIGEIEARIHDGWRARSGHAIEHFAVTLDLEPGPTVWTFRATMKPVLLRT
jgi:hypothetical protein